MGLWPGAVVVFRAHCSEHVPYPKVLMMDRHSYDAAAILIFCWHFFLFKFPLFLPLILPVSALPSSLPMRPEQMIMMMSCLRFLGMWVTVHRVPQAADCVCVSVSRKSVLFTETNRAINAGGWECVCDGACAKTACTKLLHYDINAEDRIISLSGPRYSIFILMASGLYLS